MELPLPLRGLVIGFTIAAAVGPISLLTIRRTIAHGQVYGLVSGFGVALADATYAGIAAFGLTALTGLLMSGRFVLGLIGGAIIVLLGVRTMLSTPATVAAADTARPGLPAAFLSIFALTMTNPMTILSFAAVFAGLGLVGSGFGDALVLTVAVLVGSSLWWVVLTSIVGWLRQRVSATVLLWVNRVSGAALVAFGLVAIWIAFA
jgi:threonine/homoserine/homoserine lactone efflux protein